MAPIPNKEPQQLRVGDTWQWRRDDLSEYPASVWTLTYHFRSATKYFDVVAAADGDAFLVHVDTATTASRDAGDYTWVATITDGADRFEVGSGAATLTPNYATQAAFDGRTFAAKLLAAVESELTLRGSSGSLDLVTAALESRSLTRDQRGLITLRSQLMSEVRREQAAGGANRMRVKFA